MSNSWPFCVTCGSILSAPNDMINDVIKCSCCGRTCKFSELKIDPVVTTSMPKQRPLWLDEYDNSLASFENVDDLSRTTTSRANAASSKKKEGQGLSKHATIDEPCPKCKHPTLYFYTMQLRSVDEGSTVFYECPNCNHKFSQNN
mmetsp:Transcript_7808/g.11668  ORF Transcript_7808/g.11668 Transcript_7808/m.11668 type:complete len:145 (+) Transcript_7808:32-466(+)